MNSVTLLALLILTSASRASNSNGYSDFTELDGGDFQNEFFEDELARASNSEADHREKIEDGETNNIAVNFEEIFKNPIEQPVPVLSTLNEVIGDKHFNHFSIHPVDSRNHKYYFLDEGTRRYQAPQRREAKEWKVSDDFFDSSNVPWAVDAYYPKLGQNDYVDDASYSDEKSQEAPSVVVSGDYKDHTTQAKHPQYFQKNYYYNYYPTRWGWSPQEMYSPDESKKRLETAVSRKVPSQNPCRQYLEFLKYAFERLDENAEYYYETNDEYADEWRDRESDKTHRVFGTQLLGPTFYVDNSGKISQVNSKGNSVQVAEGISPDSKVSIFSKTFSKPKPLPSTPSSPPPPPPSSSPSPSPPPSSPRPPPPSSSSPPPSSPFLPPSSSPSPPSSTTQEPVIQTSEIITTLDYQQKTVRGNYFTTLKPEISLRTEKNETEATIVSYTTQYAVKETERPASTTNFPEPSTTPLENDYGPVGPTASDEEYYGLMGRPMERKLPIEINAPTAKSSTRWFPPPTTLPPVQSTVNTSNENLIKVKTVLSTEDSAELDKSNDSDCKDKMLPCPDTVNITYPLNGYCNRYVSCESGRAIRRTCPEGLHFNLIIKSCDLPHNSFCTYVCPQPNGNFGIPGDCGGYFVCKNYNPEYRMCPPRMHWDINRGICTFSQLSSCPMKCFRDNEVRHYEGDCKAYIVCLNGIPYYHKCPPNTKFDKTALVCVPDNLSTCMDDPRLLTNTLNPNTMCKDVQIQLNTKSWCRSFIPFDKL